MLRDPAIYGPDAGTFNPYRFLDSSGALDGTVKDPTFAFGFGRRICPGRFMAYDSLWIWMANVLAAFTIANPVGEHGEVETPSLDSTTAMVM